MTGYIITLIVGAAIVAASLVGIAHHPKTPTVQAVKETEYRIKLIPNFGSTLHYRIVRQELEIVELEYGGTKTLLLTRVEFDQFYEKIP